MQFYISFRFMLNSTSKSLGRHLDGFEVPGLSQHGYSGNRRVDFLDLPLLGEGGEGWIVDGGALRKGELIKVLKPPKMVPCEETCQLKWDEYPRKLPLLMQFDLPHTAVKPTALITEKRARGSRVLGFFMPAVKGYELSELTTPDGRQAHGVSRNDVMTIFTGMHSLDRKLHAAGIILGDKKPQNYIVQGAHAHVVDLESASFGDFKCHGFTEQYLDPLLCAPELDYPEKLADYTESSDWYAFEAMLFECLCDIAPYGGIYRPGPNEEEIPESARPLKGISVFNTKVGLPQFVQSFSALPEALRSRFIKTFEQQHRGMFPPELLTLIWKLCESCDLEHANTHCPECYPFAEDLSVQWGSASPTPAQIESIPLPGFPALLSCHSDQPFVVNVQPTERGPALYINHEQVLDSVSSDTALAAPPTPTLIFIHQGGKELSIISLEQQKRWTLRDVLTPYDQPLFASASNYFGYLNAQGDLVLSTDAQMPHCCTFPLACGRAEQFVLGQKLIGIADQDSLRILQVLPDRNALRAVRIPIDRDWYLLTLEAHPTNPFLLATFARHDHNTRRCNVFGPDGTTLLHLEADRATRWWFSNQLYYNNPALMYWQEGKLCEAVIVPGARTIERRWGVQGFPPLSENHKPLIFGDHIYFIAADRAHRFSLRNGGTT